MNNLQTITNLESATPSSCIVKYYSDIVPYHTSIDIKVTGIYNLCEGLVVDVGYQEENLKYVCVKMSNDCVFRYGHLKETYFNEDARIRPGELIGLAQRYASFEYLSLSTSKFPSYVDRYKFYIQDPSDIILHDMLPSILSSESTYKHTSEPDVVLLGLQTVL